MSAKRAATEEARNLAERGSEALSAGRFDIAMHMFEGAVAAMRQAAGDQHTDTAVCKTSLAAVYRLAGRADAAHVLLREALDTLAHNFGDDHPAVTTIRASLGMSNC